MWVSHGNTESGDELPVFIWKTEPLLIEVNAKYREYLPDEFEEIGHVNWVLRKIEKAEIFE